MQFDLILKFKTFMIVMLDAFLGRLLIFAFFYWFVSFITFCNDCEVNIGGEWENIVSSLDF